MYIIWFFFYLRALKICHYMYVGTDEFGKILATKATEAGVKVNYLVQDKQPTGTCAVLITGKHRLDSLLLWNDTGLN